MKIIYSTILLVLFMHSAYADRNDGVYAYMQGDYDTAYNIMISLAKTSEDRIAQYYLGVMYMKGQGVEQDYATAGEWFRQASKHGLAAAMHKLANLYTQGKGVPKDLEFAYIWQSVAAEHGHTRSIATIDRLKNKLSEQELIAANQLITEYIDKYGPEKDAETSQ